MNSSQENLSKRKMIKKNQGASGMLTTPDVNQKANLNHNNIKVQPLNIPHTSEKLNRDRLFSSGDVTRPTDEKIPKFDVMSMQNKPVTT